jgi:hypothetical protein
MSTLAKLLTSISSEVGKLVQRRKARLQISQYHDEFYKLLVSGNLIVVTHKGVLRGSVLFQACLIYDSRQSPNTGIWTTGRCNAIPAICLPYVQYFARINPFFPHIFGSPYHVLRYIA